MTKRNDNFFLHPLRAVRRNLPYYLSLFLFFLNFLFIWFYLLCCIYCFCRRFRLQSGLFQNMQWIKIVINDSRYVGVVSSKQLGMSLQ